MADTFITSPVVERYPRALVRRPLLLPRGVFELATAVNTRVFRQANPGFGVQGDFELYDLGGSARVGLDKLELEIGVQLGVGDTRTPMVGRPDRDAVQTLFAGARFAAGSDLAIGFEAEALTPAGDSAGIATNLILVKRMRLGPRAAVEIVGVGGYFGERIAGEPELTRSTLAVGGVLKVQAQLSAGAAVQAHATQAIRKRNHDRDGEVPSPHLAQTYGLRLVIAGRDRIDFISGLSLISTGDFDVKLLSIGFVVRGLP